MDHAELSKRRVLVADDDRVSRLAMEDMLHACGPLSVTMAEDGESAWAHLSGPSHFDLVCLDVRMPAPDGLELVARIRSSLDAEAPAGDADHLEQPIASTQLEATRHELQGFIVKPVGEETAARVLKTLAQLDAAILEPADRTTARLRIDAERHRRYVTAFGQQVRALHGLATELESHGADERAVTQFVQKADGCRAVALTLGATRIEQLVGDALEAVEKGVRGASGALGLAAHWLGRVSAPMVAAAG